jgi:hypothetical protein
MVAYVRSGTDLESARSAILAVTAGRAELRDLSGSVSSRDRELELREGRYSFSELVAMQRATMEALGGDGILAVDADESLNRVRVAIADIADRQRMMTVMLSAGIPSDAMEIQQGSRAVASANLRERVRPVGGGLQIRNQWGTGLCSMGFLVDVQFYGQRSFLTAAHCQPQTAATLGLGATGTSIYQSNVGPFDLVGAVQVNPAFNKTGAECLGNTLCTLADAMLVLTSGGSTFPKRVIGHSVFGANNSPGSVGINSAWNTFVPGVAFVGQSIDKVGRTSGGTTGTVDATCESVSVHESYSIGGLTVHVYYTVTCASKVIDASVGGGDSGSPVFNRPTAVGQPSVAYGILFASNNPVTAGCTSNCQYWFSGWIEIESHLARYLTP